MGGCGGCGVWGLGERSGGVSERLGGSGTFGASVAPAVRVSARATFCSHLSSPNKLR